MLDSPLQKGSNKPEPKDLTLTAAFFVASSSPLCWRNPGFLLAKLLVVAGEIPIVMFKSHFRWWDHNISWRRDPHAGGIPTVLLLTSSVRGSESGSLESSEDKKGEKASSSGRVEHGFGWQFLGLERDRTDDRWAVFKTPFGGWL